MSKKTIRQHDISDCGAACLVSVAAHYKLFLPISRVRQLTGTDQQGTNLYGLIEGAKKIGFDAKGVRCELPGLNQVPIPAIAHLIVNKQLQHFVVIYKIKKKSIVIMDPGSGKFEQLSLDKFKVNWTGVLVILIPNDSFLPQNVRTSLFVRFWYLLKPHKYVLIQSLIGSLFYTLLGFSLSIYIQKITDHVFINENKELLNMMSIVLLLIFTLQLLLSVFKDLFLVRTGQEIDARLILGYYRHLLKLPQQFFDTMRIGELISRINDAVKIRVFINNTSLSLLSNFFIVLFSFVLMFSFNLKLGLLMLCIIPAYLIIYGISNALNKKTERQIMEASAALETQLIESFSNIRTIKQFGIYDFVQTKTDSNFIGLLKISYQSSLTHIFSNSSTQTVANVFTIMLLWIGSYAVIAKEMTAGELFSFYAILVYFTGPISNLILSNKIIQNALIAADRLFEILDVETESGLETSSISISTDSNITFKNVVFGFVNRPNIFNGLNFNIKEGSITAIVGESGAGKSTIVDLLQGIRTPTGGKILIGNQDISCYSKDALRNIISVVPQHIDLFNGSIIENIAIGELSPDIDRVIKVCNSIKINTLIDTLPKGLHTSIGRGGTLLSGGEKQKIGIARTIYKNPKIIVFDEASSSLDSHSEANLIHLFFDLIKEGKTILIITHRVVNLSFANQILVLENGIISEQGTSEELVEKKGTYRDLRENQIGHTI